MSDIGLKWYGEQIKSVVLDALEQEIVYIMEDLHTQSIAQVPMDAGDLKKNFSAVLNGETIIGAEVGETVSVPDCDGFSAVAGYTLPYAVKQHEDMSLRHNDGKAKFLEDPFNANQDKYMQDLADTLGRFLG